MQKLFGLISFVCFLLFLVFWGAYPKRHCLDWSFKGFAYIFRVLELKFLCLTHFEVTFTQWGLGINYESSSCGHPIFLVPFMKLSVLSPGHILGTSEELPLAVSCGFSLDSAFGSTVHLIISLRVAGCGGHFGSAACLEIRCCAVSRSPLLLSIALAIEDLLCFPMNFKIVLVLWKTLLLFPWWLYWTHKSHWVLWTL